MTPGLPGAGVSGLFYLAAALLTPAWELFRACRGDTSASRLKLALRHALLATCVLCGVWATAWLVGAIASSPIIPGRDPAAVDLNRAYAQVLGRRMALFTAMTLAAVLCAIEFLRLWRLVTCPRRDAADRPSSRAPRTLPAAVTDDAA